MRMSDWSSDVCSSYLRARQACEAVRKVDAAQAFVAETLRGAIHQQRRYSERVHHWIWPKAAIRHRSAILNMSVEAGGADEFGADSFGHPQSIAPAGLCIPHQEDRKSTRLNSSH